MNIIIPAVKHGVISFGFRKILQGVVTDKYLLGVFELIREHVKGHSTAFLANKRIDIQCTVAVIPILAQRTQIVRGSE